MRQSHSFVDDDDDDERSDDDDDDVPYAAKDMFNMTL
jgi:hypothetical protein